MLQEAVWAKALLGALDEYINKKKGGTPAAVPAAPLKPLLVRHAEQLGLAFPPEGYERTKFVDFLSLFPTVVTTHRRAGQDTLVAKATDAQLLDEAAQAEAHQTAESRTPQALRQDVFQAFTKTPASGSSHWYAVDQDRFVQAEAGEPNWILVPSPSIDAAIQERRNFAAAQISTLHKEALLAALSDSVSPLASFSVEVKKQRLSRVWHAFRLRSVIQRISDWAAKNGVPWNSSWESEGNIKSQQPNNITTRETNSFLSGLMQLGPEDAKRVMVPLDIVLKLMRRE